MRFEHLIQINDPLMPLLDTLTREQLWRGLVLRAEDPTQFVPGLEVVTIHSRQNVGDQVELVRTLDFGTFKVEDRVRLTPHRRSEIHTSRGSDLAGEPHEHRDRRASAGAAIPALLI